VTRVDGGVFANRVLRKDSGAKREEVRVGRWKLHCEEPHDLYCLAAASNQMEENEMGKVCGTKENALDLHETWCFTRRRSEYKTIPKSEIGR
jgi:hypothetical protein